jgi:hypothetical protein
MEKILLDIFFVLLTKRETCPYNACLPLLQMQDVSN